MKVAIVGSGIAGLAAAFELHKQGVDFTLFEAEDYLGGHARTVQVPLAQDPKPLVVDLGVFMHEPRCLHSRVAALAKELSVATHPFELSISLVHHGLGIDYAGTMDPSRTRWQGIRELAKTTIRELSSFHGCRTAPLLIFIDQLYRRMPQVLESDGSADLSLQDYLEQDPYSESLVEAWLIPNLFCWWGVPREQAMNCNLSVILDSLYRTPQNEQFLFSEGWQAFIDAIAKPFNDKVRLSSTVQALSRKNQGLELSYAGRHEIFNSVILAIPPNRCLDLLKAPSSRQKALLSPFTTSTTTVFLHRDARWAPSIHRRGIINLVTDELGSYTTLWSGGLDPRKPPVFVTWGDPLREAIRTKDLIQEAQWNRTLPCNHYAKASREIESIQGQDGIWYCGAHVHALGDGLPPSLWHENALVSGQKAAHSLMTALKD